MALVNDTTHYKPITCSDYLCQLEFDEYANHAQGNSQSHAKIFNISARV